jgi:hypothetical protein
MIIYGDAPNDDHHAKETRNFFYLICEFFIGPSFSKMKVDWGDTSWCEAEDIHNMITTGVNYIKLISEMASYLFTYKRQKKYLFETRQWLQDKIIGRV